MNENGLVLVLSENQETANSIAVAISSSGPETVVVNKPGEAVKKLTEAPYDLLIVDLGKESGATLSFLEKARDLLPKTERAIYEEQANGAIDLRELVNRVSPVAVFSGTVNVDTVNQIVKRHRKMIRSLTPARPAASAGPRMKNPSLIPTQRSRPTGAKASFDPTVEAVNFADMGQSAFAKRKETERKMSQTAESRHETPAAKPASAEKKPQLAEDDTEPGPPAESPWEAPQHENRKIELDLMQDDMVAEVARVLDLLLEEPDVRLPVLPQVANEVRKLLAKEDVSFEQIAEVVAIDPSMSARILEVANSPLYGGKERIRNLQQAVSRIGMRETRNILLAVSVENLFAVGDDKRMNVLMTKLWMHSLACAYANEIMAKDLYIEESSDFFMMGLLHDIGKLLIIHLIQQGYERKIWTRKNITDEMLDELLETRHNILGARVMIKWEYDKSFQDVVFYHNDDDSKVCQHEEPVVVAYYSNLLTRKMGFSLKEYPKDRDPLGGHDIAQALNMSPDVRDRVEKSLRETVDKIRESYRS
ncbi:MAG: HDOD domain-containing protein [Candidatus Sumerlaeota bacterium]